MLGQSSQQQADLGDEVVGPRSLLGQSKGVAGEARSRGLRLSTSDWVDDDKSTKERKRES